MGTDDKRRPNTGDYEAWFTVAEALSGNHPLAVWKRRARHLEARFESHARPLDTYKRYLSRMKKGQSLRFESVKYLALALQEHLTIDERGPKLSPADAAARLGISLEAVEPSVLRDYLLAERTQVGLGTIPVSDCSAESVRCVLSLRTSRDGFTFVNSLTKRLRFHKPFRREITSSVWPCVRWDRPQGRPAGTWGTAIVSGSREFVATSTPVVELADHLELKIRFWPQPEPGDYVEYERWFASPDLNPLYRDQFSPTTSPAFVVGGSAYDLYDGIFVSEPTRKLCFRCEFVASYGLTADAIVPFVGKRSGLIDTLLPEESARVDSRIESFGGDVVAEMIADQPKEGLFYGFGWRLPPRAR